MQTRNDAAKPGSSAWSLRRPLPFGIADAPSTSYGHEIFVFGGYGVTPGDVKSCVLRYSLDEDVWSVKKSMSKPRWGAAAASHEGRAYVFGGVVGLPGYLTHDLPASKAVECYEIAEDSWTTLKPLPKELRGHGLMAVTVQSMIYLFKEASTFEYDPSNDSYLRRANAPIPRRWATCACVKLGLENSVHIIGGFDSSVWRVTDANYCYLPKSDEWIGPRAPAPYRALGVTRDNPVWQGRIYFGFGHRKPDMFYNEMHIYDPEKDSWTGPLPRAIFPRDGVACAVVDDWLYVIGGRSEPNDSLAFGLTHNERLALRSQVDLNPCNRERQLAG